MSRLKPPSIEDVLRKPRRKVSKLISAEKRKLAHWAWLGRKGWVYARNRYYLLHIANLSCSWCGSREKRVCDHKLPRALGGSHDLKNLQVLCAVCHRIKTRWDMRFIRKYKKTGRRVYVEPSGFAGIGEGSNVEIREGNTAEGIVN